MKKHDHTERFGQENGDRRAIDQYESLVSRIPGVAYRCAPTPNRIMQFVSAGVERLIGRRASEFVGDGARLFGGITHQDDSAAV